MIYRVKEDDDSLFEFSLPSKKNEAFSKDNHDRDEEENLETSTCSSESDTKINEKKKSKKSKDIKEVDADKGDGDSNMLSQLFNCGDLTLTSSSSKNSKTEKQGIFSSMGETFQNIYTETMETLIDYENTMNDVMTAFSLGDKDLVAVAEVLSEEIEGSKQSMEICGSLDDVNDVTNKIDMQNLKQDSRSRKILHAISEENSGEESEDNGGSECRGEESVDDSAISNSPIPTNTSNDSTVVWQNRETPPRKTGSKVVTPTKKSNHKSKGRKIYKLNDFRVDSDSSYLDDDSDSESENESESDSGPVSLLQLRMKSASIEESSSREFKKRR